MVGNEDGARLLVRKREELLAILDNNGESPLDIALSNTKLDTSAYLLKSALPSYSSSYRHVDPKNATKAIVAAIFTKQYDLAGALLEKYPDIARHDNFILFIIAITFPTDLSPMESFIYPSFHNVLRNIVERVSFLFHSNVLDKCVNDILQAVKICNNMCCSWLGNISMIFLVPVATLYQLICLLIRVLQLPFSMVYLLTWKVLAVTVCLDIKNIEKAKKEYKEGKKILSLICEQMGTSNDGYDVPLLKAVHHGAYEVVDEILFRAPDKINCENEEGHNIIQLAIINRSENTYNLVYHIIDRAESYRKRTDSSENNLAHLVGRLAPSLVLDRTTGAALQLQRELLWRKEVEKLMSPAELLKLNVYEETPAMVFTREHRDLMLQGENWMKTTAESCSITAALIVTVVFAAAITVPGGAIKSPASLC